jgi:MFS family permease
MLWSSSQVFSEFIPRLRHISYLQLLTYLLNSFQKIQNKTPLLASLRLLPNLLVGVCINLSVGVFVDKLPARWLVVISSILCSGASLLMALLDPSWSYWYAEFWAQLLAPLSGDVLFTVGLIIVSDVFPEDTQALAGAVFNTVAQFGMSFGLSILQVVSLSVTGNAEGDAGRVSLNSTVVSDDPTDVDISALLKGYRASFWTMFGCMILSSLIAVVGLRKVGKIGVKRE